MNIRLYLSVSMLLTFAQSGWSQSDLIAINNRKTSGMDTSVTVGSTPFSFFATVQPISGSSAAVPFWFRANRFGSVPTAGTSLSSTVGIVRNYQNMPRKVDWGFGFETRANLGQSSKLIIIEGYGKLRYGALELKAGRTRDVMGLVDSTLSTGAFAVSGNSLGIPKVQIAMPEYWTIPIFSGLFAVKGNFALGLFGDTPIGSYIGAFDRSDVPVVKSYYHQKSLYGRLGKPSWRLKVYAGFNHQTMFGNEGKIFNNFNLTQLETIYYAVTGKTWYDDKGRNTKLGNQIGSIDAGLTYELKSSQIFLYRQQFYDVGALAHLANVRDGLTGLAVKNTRVTEGKLSWHKILFEFFYSKNQAGELWSKLTPSGDEDYYNNFMYLQGWSYKGVGIGNPLITPRSEARKNLRFKEDQHFINNRVIAYHIGGEFGIGRIRLTSKLSYSKNLGTFGTSPIGNSRNRNRFKIEPPYFTQVNQFSGFLSGQVELPKRWICGVEAGFDQGQLLPNSFSAGIRLTKTLRF